MTGNDMLATLGLRLEDPEESSFTQTAKLDALNIAQRTVVNLVDNAYLGELQVIVANQAMVGHGITYTVLAAHSDGGQPIRNGIIAVKIYNGKWCTMIEPGDQKRLENTYLSTSTTNPVAYVFGEKVYVDGTAASTTAIDVWYLRQPVAIAADAVECEMNIALHEVVIDLAESQLWKMDAKMDRAAAAYSNGTAQITALNARYPAEAPSGIGTKNRV
jgi:hypothetical protein